MLKIRKSVVCSLAHFYRSQTTNLVTLVFHVVRDGTAERLDSGYFKSEASVDLVWSCHFAVRVMSLDHVLLADSSLTYCNCQLQPVLNCYHLPYETEPAATQTAILFTHRHAHAHTRTHTHTYTLRKCSSL